MEVAWLVVVGLVSGAFGCYGTIWLLHRWAEKHPLVEPGTNVRFLMGDDPETAEDWSTGTYLRRLPFGFSRVVPNTPLWWSAARDGREIVVADKRFDLTRS